MHTMTRINAVARGRCRQTVRWLAGLATAAGLSACGGGGSGGVTVNDTSLASASWVWSLPTGMPAPRVPTDNPMSAAKVDLGRHLFYDTRLSGNGTQACASCHQQDKAFTDGRARAVGSTGEGHPRNAQGLANVAYHPTLTWANPGQTSLEQQMQVPLFGTSPVEMGINDANKDAVLQRLRDATLYQQKFATVWPGDAQPITWTHVTQAIAAFQRTLMSFNSKHDRVQRGQASYSEAEARGAQLFFGEKAECFHCHGSANFNDQLVHAGTRVTETPFHNTGLYNIDGAGGFPYPNRGVFELTGNAWQMGMFRAPSLRNVEKTAPYMHDGTIATLEAVLDFYAAGGRHVTGQEGDAFLAQYPGDGRLNPYKDSLIARINLSDQDKADLVAFLKTLTDEQFLNDPTLSNPFQ
jgi:cytochrome c peroxidase